MIKLRAAVAALLALWGAAGAAGAAEFRAARGINLDIWTTWPAEARWGEPDALLPFPEWRRTVGEAELRALREAGFDFVRVPVDPAPFLSERAAALRPELLREVRRAADAVVAAGLKVVVDLHLIPAGGGRSVGMDEVMASEERFADYVALVRDVAGALADADPGTIAFEPMNEPAADCESDGARVWPERQKRLWAAARAAAPKLTIVLTGACFSSAEALAAVDPADTPDRNVVWTFHSYRPFLLTHQGATWAGDFIPHVTGLPFPPHAVPRAEWEAALERVRETIRRDAPWTRRAGLLAFLDEEAAKVDTAEELAAAMEEPFDLVAAWATRHGIAPDRVLLGEFGMIRQEWENPSVTPPAARAAYVRLMAEAAERRGFAWAVWGYGGAFGVVEAFEGRPAEPDVLEAIRQLPPRE